MNIEEEMINAIKSLLMDSLKKYLVTDYNNPLKPTFDAVIAKNQGALQWLLNAEIEELVNSPEYRNQLRGEIRSLFAKKLVEKFSGSLEKEMNNLKSDPVMRSKITIGIDNLVKDCLKSDALAR